VRKKTWRIGIAVVVVVLVGYFGFRVLQPSSEIVIGQISTAVCWRGTVRLFKVDAAVLLTACRGGFFVRIAAAVLLLWNRRRLNARMARNNFDDRN